MSILNKIKTLPFPSNLYFPENVDKHQIVLHHTASGKGITGDYKTFLNNPVRIATCIIVDYDGTPNQLFSSKQWAMHLGIPTSVFSQHGITNSNNRSLDKHSIGIEIDAWGPLGKGSDGKYYSWSGTMVDESEVVHYPNGYRFYPMCPKFKELGIENKPAIYYHKYSKEQIETVRQLLILWKQRYGIPLTYNEDMWDVSKRALSGVKGVWSHTSYRKDKSDCHPQTDLIAMLKSLSI